MQRHQGLCSLTTSVLPFFTLYIAELPENDKEKNLFLPYTVKFDLMYTYIHLLLLVLLLWGLLIPNIKEILICYEKQPLNSLHSIEN